MTDDPLLGQQLDEYRLEALLGQGGMASVYRALDVHLHRYAAVKIIRTSFRADSDYVIRFEREAQAIAKLEHPNIVHLYRYGEVQGLLYMAMQYIEGADLGSVLASYQADHEFIEPDEARRIVRQMCLALDYAHSKGVIHRDVKPSNIMLDKQGNVFLTDFGLALSTEIGTRGEIFGSPHYIAPEQAVFSANAIPQSDLYAVGVILYEMFTGQLPFVADNPLDIAMLHLTEPVRPPRELRPELSLELEAVIIKALAKEPPERYPTGAALADALEQALRVKAKAPATVMALRRTVPERISADLAHHPLPPIPATAATPAPRSSEPAWTGVAAPASKSRPWLALAVGAGVGLVLIMLLCLLSVLWLWRAGQPGGAATTRATLTATITPALTATSKAPVPVTLPAATFTLAPTATVSPTQTPVSSTPAPLVYKLLIAKRDDDSLFVVNQSPEDFPLASLRLGETDKDGIRGEEWEIDALGKGACVTAWKDTGNPQSPNIRCNRVGERVTRDSKRVFWKSTFNVYYAGRQVGICDKGQSECSLNIPAR